HGGVALPGLTEATCVKSVDEVIPLLYEGADPEGMLEVLHRTQVQLHACGLKGLRRVLSVRTMADIQRYSDSLHEVRGVVLDQLVGNTVRTRKIVPEREGRSKPQAPQHPRRIISEGLRHRDRLERPVHEQEPEASSEAVHCGATGGPIELEERLEPQRCRGARGSLNLRDIQSRAIEETA